MVCINGETKDAAGMTITQYLHAAQYNLARIAIELNGKIIRKEDFDAHTLADGDVLEIISFVGGG